MTNSAICDLSRRLDSKRRRISQNTGEYFCMEFKAVSFLTIHFRCGPIGGTHSFRPSKLGRPATRAVFRARRTGHAVEGGRGGMPLVREARVSVGHAGKYLVLCNYMRCLRDLL